MNDPNSLKAIVQVTIQRVLELKTTEHLRTRPHERTDAWRGHQNG